MSGEQSGLWRQHQAELLRIEATGLARQLHHAHGAAGPWIERGGRRLLNLSSNNYLDLAAHHGVVAAAQAAAERHGAGASGSRLITGSSAVHEELESTLAAFKGAEAALVFSSGFMASLGLVSVLAAPARGLRSPVVFDRLCHACIVDGAMQSGSPWRSFHHNNPEALDDVLGKLSVAGTTGGDYRAVVVTEGVFSMDGDLAPLPDLLAVCEKWDALLVVDDAHATGTIGPSGRGSAAHFGVTGHPLLIHLGTLSKALGSQGGFVAGPQVLKQVLVNRARTFIFDTALAPPAAAAALAALKLIEADGAPTGRLSANSVALRAALRGHGLEVPDSPSPVVPIVLGGAEDAVQVSGAVAEAGFLGVAIRPPTVPPGTSRIRLTVMATHPGDGLTAAAEAVARALQARMPSQ